MKNKTKGFTLIELLVVIAIIGLLSSVILASLSVARAKARDTKRIAEIKQLQTALELYFSTNGVYPDSNNNGNGGWSVGNQTLGPLLGGKSGVLGSYIGDLADPTATGNNSGYFYYRYSSAWGYTGTCSGKSFYVIGLNNIESRSGVYPTSPGWSCTERNWQNEFQWVTGNFES